MKEGLKNFIDKNRSAFDDQVPSEKNLSDPNNPVNKEDAALDRKIKSICRGC